jgi:hypothetical protein
MEKRARSTGSQISGDAGLGLAHSFGECLWEPRLDCAIIRPTCAAQASPCSSPKCLRAAAVYSDGTPSTISTVAVPLMSSTL